MRPSRHLITGNMLTRLASFAFLAVVTLFMVARAEASAPSNQWWNSSYQYREKITIAAGTVNVPTQYSVRVQFNHAALVMATKSLSSGNDIRIVYWNGSTWTELDRRLDDQSSWNSATTQVWFRTQTAINANQRDDNYYIYYGNNSAGAPPTTWSDIFLFYDDFNDGSFDTARWTCVSGTCSESGGNLSLRTYSRAWATATYTFGTDTCWESRARLGGDGSVAYFDFSVTGQGIGLHSGLTIQRTTSRPPMTRLLPTTPLPRALPLHFTFIPSTGRELPAPASTRTEQG